MIEFEPAALLRCWAIDVDIGAATYTIPAKPAAEWLLAIVEQEWGDIVPGMFDDPTVLDDRMVDGLVDPAVLRRAAQQALQAAAGCRWWTARTLAYLAMSTTLAGEVMLAGVDPERASLGAYLAAAYQAAVRNMPRDERIRIDARLQAPPRDVPAEEWYDEAGAMDQFRSLMAAQG